jgi:hypothetical protein
MTLENQFPTETGSPADANFHDRRDPIVQRTAPGLERRQFYDVRETLSPEAAELGAAIDHYKLVNRRRYISYEEMLSVITSLGYKKTSQ